MAGDDEYVSIPIDHVDGDDKLIVNCQLIRWDELNRLQKLSEDDYWSRSDQVAFTFDDSSPVCNSTTVMLRNKDNLFENNF